MCFWPKPFLEPHASPDAAAIISLRSGSKATGNSWSFITAFLKSTTLLSTSPHSSPFWLYHGATQFSRTRVLNHCAIWPPSPRRVWRRTGSQNLLVLWWAEGAISPTVLGTVAGWSALQVSLGQTGESPKFCRTTWYSCRADTKNSTLGIDSRPVLRALLGEVAASLSTIQICL